MEPGGRLRGPRLRCAAMRFQVLPGFRDFFPEDLAIRRTIEAAWHGAARTAGFEEFDGPVLESYPVPGSAGTVVIDSVGTGLANRIPR